jgi:hypothetical protein
MDKNINLSRSGILIFRIGLVLALVAIVLIGTLKVLERTGEPLRQGIQKYIADVTHSRVYVAELPDPEFFPNVHITVQGVIFSDMDSPEKKLAEAGKIEFSIPFVNLMIGRQAFETLRVENLSIEKNVILPQSLTITKMDIMPGTSPALKAVGTYGTQPLDMHVDLMQRPGTPVYYTLPLRTGVGLTLGPASVEGVMDSTASELTLQETVLRGKKGVEYGPQNFFIVKNQEFIKNNPVSCLLDHYNDLRLTAGHPCVTLFQRDE